MIPVINGYVPYHEGFCFEIIIDFDPVESRTDISTNLNPHRSSETEVNALSTESIIYVTASKLQQIHTCTQRNDKKTRDR